MIKGNKASSLLSVSSVGGTLSYFKRKIVLNYREEKPTLYKMQAVRGPVIRKKEFIAYAANAAHVPESTITMAQEAILQAVIYYCAQGRAVEIPGLGSFQVCTRQKMAHTADEANGENIMQKYLRWYPTKELQQLGSSANVKLVEDKSLTKMALGEEAG